MGGLPLEFGQGADPLKETLQPGAPFAVIATPCPKIAYGPGQAQRSIDIVLGSPFQGGTKVIMLNGKLIQLAHLVRTSHVLLAGFRQLKIVPQMAVLYLYRL